MRALAKMNARKYRTGQQRHYRPLLAKEAHRENRWKRSQKFTITGKALKQEETAVELNSV